MRPDPDFHPQTEATMPLPPVEGGEGVGVPVDPVTGRGVRPVSGEVEGSETRLTLHGRTYNGVRGAVLSMHSDDIWNMLSGGPRLIGAAERASARMSAAMATAVWAYIVVKNALALLAAPLRPKVGEQRSNYIRRAQRSATVPKAPVVWLTKAPTEAEWDARDLDAGYDIRGTSPTWVRRRVYRHRAKRRKALEAPYEREARAAKRQETTTQPRAEFIGPPMPRHYKDVEDIGLIWPPVPRPNKSQGILPPIREAAFIPASVRERLREDAVAVADGLIEGYNYALEQFGFDATLNYRRGLRRHEADFIEAYVRGFYKIPAQGRAPP